MGGDQPDWTELGKVPSAGNKKRGPDARAPDWHADPAKYAAKRERDARERGELVVAVGPFCVPCGKRFAKQTVYDAHLSGKKHLAALQRMGRDEEAMVCQLDVEAKRRKMAAFEEAREAERRVGTGMAVAVDEVESAEAAAARLAAREEKLRQRAMLPMPSTVAAASVYGEAEEEDPGTGGEGSSSSAPLPTLPVKLPTLPAKAPPIEAHTEAAAAGGASMSYTSGMQDGEQRVNRHTSAGLAAAHRELAVPRADWFNPQHP